MNASKDQTPQHSVALVTLHAGYHHSSLALRSIAAFCRDEPFFADLVIHEGLVKSGNDELFAALVAARPRLVGFSTYLWNIQPILRMARNLKQLLPEARIVFGGPEAGPRGEELLAREAWLDFVIDGEGELAFRDLARWCLRDAGDCGQVSGLVWRDADGSVHRNPMQLLPPEQWVSPYTCGLGALDKPLVYWETSRGCPYRCTFCTSSTDRLRTASLAQVDADLAIFRQLGGRDAVGAAEAAKDPLPTERPIAASAAPTAAFSGAASAAARQSDAKTIKLLDRSFHLGAQRTLQLLQRFIDTPDTLRFHLELNPDRVSDEALALFAEAPPGKFQFEIGLQTLSDAVLERIDRTMDVPRGVERIRELVALRRHPVHLDLIAGLPGEDADSCRRSLDEVFVLYADHLQLGILKLLPGTPLREQAERFGYRWDAEPPYEILCHEHLTHDELMHFKHYAELLERLWNNGLLCHTLMWLVERYFDGQVSRCFDRLLAGPARSLATERRQPDYAFGRMVDEFADLLSTDAVLMQLLLWDYAHHGPVSGKTPSWIAGHLRGAETLMRSSGNRRMPVLELGATAATVVNRRRCQPLAPGRYAVWAQRERKGRPVEILSVA